MKTIWEFFIITLGSLLVALSFNLFLIKFNIAFGGVGGISIITQELFAWRPALTQGILNILLLICGFFFLGKRFGAKSVYGTLSIPYFVYLTETLPPVTTEPLLAALYGGVGTGLGLGLVLRSRASTGGTDLVAQIIYHFWAVRHGLSIQLLDGLIVFTAGVVFGPESALYALITLFIVGKTIDAAQTGLRYAKVSFIISEEQEKLRQVLLQKMDRGVTKIPAYGGFTDMERPILMCVVNRREMIRLKSLVQEVDPEAFMIVSDASEVLGEGFKRESN